MLDDENKRYLIKKRDEIIKNCPICHGTVPYCKCTYEFRVEINKATSNIPIVYRDFTIDQLTHPQLYKQKQEVINFLQTVGTPAQRDLIITGGPGLAKSAVACLILIKLLQQNKKVYYFPSLRSVMDACLSEYKGDSENDIFSKFESAHTIVIDGLGYGFIRERSNGTDIVLEHLERRRLSGKHVVFVSSVSVDDLAGGERTFIDLLQPKVIDFKGFNYVKEVLEKVDTKKATAVKKVSVRNIRRKKDVLREDGTLMSPLELALKAKQSKKKPTTRKKGKRK